MTLAYRIHLQSSIAEKCLMVIMEASDPVRDVQESRGLDINDIRRTRPTVKYPHE